MANPYDVLGVTAKASAADIKKAYRRLAKKLHPDANKNDPKTAAKFSEINSAYEIVGDEEKRKAFDSGAIDAEGKPRFQGFEGFGGHPGARSGPGQGAGFESFTFGPEGVRRGGGRGGAGGFSGFEDILSNVFGGGRAGARPGFGGGFAAEDLATAGRDVAGAVTISLEDIARGAKARVQLPTGKEIEVKIPAGLSDGQQIRLKGQGMPGAGGGPAGDALITVHIAPHPYFKVEGADLRVDIPITLYEAVLGGKVRVPTLEGAVDLAMPANTNTGRTFRLKGKGLPSKSGHGNLFATVRIVLPNEPDEALEALMREWRENKPYNPRAEFE
jgi:DnaJ-class molecular chaperone